MSESIDTGIKEPKMGDIKVVQISPTINITVESSEQLEHLLQEVRALINHTCEFVYKVPKPPFPKEEGDGG
jgi:hypothetical protein